MITASGSTIIADPSIVFFAPSRTGMNTMMRDLALSKSTKKSAATILECVGADIDEPKRNISFQQVSDVGTISTGG